MFVMLLLSRLFFPTSDGKARDDAIAAAIRGSRNRKTCASHYKSQMLAEGAITSLLWHDFGTSRVQTHDLPVSRRVL
jgi:hypothetical protein